MKYLLSRAAATLVSIFAAMLVTSPALAALYTLSAPAPTATFAGVPTVISSNFSIVPGLYLDYCTLIVDGIPSDDLSITSGNNSAGTVSVTHTYDLAGSHMTRVNCYDDLGGNFYNETNVSVINDLSGPALRNLAPTTAVAGTPTAVSVTYDDSDFGSGLDYCQVSIDGVATGSMTLSGGAGSTYGSATESKSFTAGTHSLGVSCYDRAGNNGYTLGTINVSSPADTTNPVTGLMSHSPTSPTVGTVVTLSVSPTDNVGITGCDLYLGGSMNGAMTLSGSTYSRTYTFTDTTEKWFYARCRDAAGNTSSSSDVYLTATSGTPADTTAPVVSSINPTAATVGSPVNVSASFSDNVGVSSCSLYVNDSFVATMDRTGTVSGTAARSYTFPSAASYNVRVSCSDAAGNTASASRTITATASGSISPYANRLVKLVCPAGYIDVNHPCKAVYYVGSDSKRHAFPNERVYFTWYSAFGDILELDGGALAGITLGSNVNYRPGMRMVKFTTVNKVYAVGRYGSLRWITSEAIATSLYGSSWNTKIDDLSDAFYTDYSFGTDILSISSFNPTVEAATASNIDANLR